MAEWSGPPFTGAKIALLCGEEIVVYKRDDKPDIPFPGLWDFPGGGREGDELPIECALREVREEFGIVVSPASLIWESQYPSWFQGEHVSFFFVATIAREEIAKIQFGDEGQYWEMMPVDVFLQHKEAVPYLQERLKEALQGIQSRLAFPALSRATPKRPS